MILHATLQQEFTLDWQLPTAAIPSAVALVLHGLNVAPAAMTPLTRALHAMGIATLRCALSGHGANYCQHPSLPPAAARSATLGRVTYRLWREEAAAAYRVAAQGAASLGGVPLYLAAFSLGGLIGCTAALDDAGVRFARQVLFAPALAIHRRSYVLRPLAPWPRLVIPSAAPPAYRANPGTSMAAYTALYTAAADLAQGLDSRLDIPTLLFVDPQDELVSAHGIRDLIRRRHLTRWRLFPIRKSPPAATGYHHLLIDPPSAGPATWQAMMSELRTFLAA
jgi:alpha-beta hydrolase superfamily lysophospholipase